MQVPAFNQSMDLIVIHKNGLVCANKGHNLLQFAICSGPPVSILFSCLNGYHQGRKRHWGICGNSRLRGNNNTIAIPRDWATKTIKAKSDIIYYEENLPLSSAATRHFRVRPWLIVSNGRFATQVDHQWLHKILTQLQADVIAVNVLPQLQAAHEKVSISPQGWLIGFRRFYDDSAQPAPIPDDWPHYLFIKTDILRKLLVDGALPLPFPDFINRCSSRSLMAHSFNIGGTVFDLETEEGLLGLLVTTFNSSVQNHSNLNNNSHRKIAARKNITISPTARLFGNVLLGQNVSIGQNVIIIGPTIIGNDVKIAKGVLIRTSIIGSSVSVPQNHIIQNQVLTDCSIPKGIANKFQIRKYFAKIHAQIIFEPGQSFLMPDASKESWILLRL